MALRTFFRIAVDELPEGDPRKSLSRRCGRVLRGLKRRARKKQIRRELRDLERLAGPPEREMQRWEAPPEGEPVPEPQGERGEGID
jgi:hypothetical protein